MARQLRLKLDALIKDSGASENFVGIEHLPQREVEKFRAKGERVPWLFPLPSSLGSFAMLLAMASSLIQRQPPDTSTEHRQSRTHKF